MADVYLGKEPIIMKRMKMTLLTILTCGTLALQVAAQPKPGIGIPSSPSAQAGAEMTTFDLDFPGGDPQSLVNALNLRLDGTLNVIIHPEHLNVKIPALKMRNVNVAQVFDALQKASVQQVMIPSGYMEGLSSPGGGTGRRMTYQERTKTYGFRTGGDRITPNPIWYFYVEGMPSLQQPAPVCRFYQLSSFLDAYKIEDIVTAIQIGWKMLADGDPNPELKFHQETQLLVAVGQDDKLKMIKGNDAQAREVLQQTVIKVARYARRFESEEVFWNWATRLARSCWIDETRKASRYLRLLEAFWNSSRDRERDHAIESMMTDAIHLLPPEDRTLLVHKYVEGRSVRELAAALETTGKAVESRLTRARQKLREILESQAKT